MAGLEYLKSKPAILNIKTHVYLNYLPYYFKNI